MMSLELSLIHNRVALSPGNLPPLAMGNPRLPDGRWGEGIQYRPTPLPALESEVRLC
jgi:hypothetical protein